MNIPNFIHEKFVDDSGNLTTSWGYWFDQLIQQLKSNVGTEGYVLPPLTATQLTQLTNSPDGTLVWDTTDKLIRVSVGGVWKTVAYT